MQILNFNGFLMQILFLFFILKIRTKFRETPGFRTGDRAQDIPNMYSGMWESGL